MPVLHKQIYRPGIFGGVRNTTACGRVRQGLSDGSNVAATDDEVTCKFCRVKIENGTVPKSIDPASV